MKWIKLQLETTVQAEELVGAMLAELGIEGIEIEDNVPLSEEDKQRMFIDILPELPEDDGTARISFYVDTDTDIEALRQNVSEGLSNLSEFINVGSGQLKVSETEDKDWINNWKQFFKPFRAAQDILIRPTWEKADDLKPGDMVVQIDPGTAFGTGSHETTRLCILNLRKCIKENASLLDVGCGSGILSIIGKMLGAKHVTGVDIDENAAAISVENAEINGYGKEDIRFLSGNVIEDEALRHDIGLDCFDVVVANILADIIIPLSGVVGEFMKKDALFISSGIIDTKAEDVKLALAENGFEVVEVCTMGDWVSVTARKK